MKALSLRLQVSAPPKVKRDMWGWGLRFKLVCPEGSRTFGGTGIKKFSKAEVLEIWNHDQNLEISIAFVIWR